MWRAFYFLWKSCERQRKSKWAFHFLQAEYCRSTERCHLTCCWRNALMQPKRTATMISIMERLTSLAMDPLIEKNSVSSLCVESFVDYCRKQCAGTAKTTTNRWKYVFDDEFHGFVIIFTFPVAPAKWRITPSNQNSYSRVACHILIEHGNAEVRLGNESSWPKKVNER